MDKTRHEHNLSRFPRKSQCAERHSCAESLALGELARPAPQLPIVPGLRPGRYEAENGRHVGSAGGRLTHVEPLQGLGVAATLAAIRTNCAFGRKSEATADLTGSAAIRAKAQKNGPNRGC
jgi:hypothetical protein